MVASASLTKRMPARTRSRTGSARQRSQSSSCGPGAFSPAPQTMALRTDGMAVGQTGGEIVPLRADGVGKGTDISIVPVFVRLGIVEGQTNRYAEAVHKAGELLDRLGVGKPAFEL